MYIKCLAAIAAAFSAFAFVAIEPAMADGTPVVHRVIAKKIAYKSSYKQRRSHASRYVRGPWPGGPDPYAYSYNRPGYYPHYNGKMWVPRKQMLARSRYPMRIPEYHSSWGYPLACKIHGRKHCGVAFKAPAGDPAHYYNREQQLRLTGSPHHNY